jgi:4-hydroxythreonine-4-phosphate dehydrogenase
MVTAPLIPVLIFNISASQNCAGSEIATRKTPRVFNKAPAPLAITMGDAAGIGPEIIARHIETHGVAGLVVIGDAGVLGRAFLALGSKRPILALAPEAALERTAKNEANGPVPVIHLGELPPDLPFGRIDARAGALAHAAICTAIDLAMAGKIAGMVTAPIHKEALHAAGVPFPGHTEILAHRTGTRDFGMMLADATLRVVLVSIHLSLREALEKVTRENVLKTIRLADQGCRALGIASPRIAVAGLNPHAGEGGLFGPEEIEIIAPAVADARTEGLDASGPFAPDTVFMRAKAGDFDAVVAQYHDQGLIPIKLNGIEHGVNITLGLPIIRTSVDHGTAFDIAGKGLASAASLTEAIRVARAMASVRNSQL